MNPKLSEAVDLFRKDGHSEKEVQRLIEDISKAATAKLFAEMVTSLTEEDLAEIDKCTSQEEANIEIRTRFGQRSGRNPDEIMQEFLTIFAQGFLEQYQKDKKAQKVT